MTVAALVDLAARRRLGADRVALRDVVRRLLACLHVEAGARAACVWRPPRRARRPTAPAPARPARDRQHDGRALVGLRAALRGSGRSPVPDRLSEALSTVSTSKPSCSRAARAAATSLLTTAGTVTWSLRSSSSAAISDPDDEQRGQREQPPVARPGRRPRAAAEAPRSAAARASIGATGRNADHRHVRRRPGVADPAAGGLQRVGERARVGVAGLRLLAQRPQHDLSSAGVTAGLIALGASGASSTCLSAIATALSPSNGTRAVSIS